MNVPHVREPVLDVRDLRMVSAIAREGGVARAAQVLHVTQSALSHHLRGLEARIGVPLFERVGRRVVLNGQGARIVALADRVLAELVSVEDALRAPSSVEPAFRVTMGCYTVYPWLPSLLSRFAKEQPGTRCEIIVEATRRATQAVLDGEVDAAIVPNPARDDRLRVHPAFREELVVAMRPDNPLASQPRVAVRDLGRETVYMHEMPAEQLAWFRAALGKSATALRSVVRIPLTEAIVDLVRAGMGVAILGSRTVTRDVAGGQLVTRPLRPAIKRLIAVVTARERERDARADRLASVLSSTVMLQSPSPRRHGA